ncbi:hypothetical protein [Pedobacter boryungensis]|uniref:IPTL-CTERM protein sorting domain-containing protein n=1 Tax=Pedobacter boryungensis TaxID=869962 RepID=A0ABX2DGN1_9SPHI|nr:hypothetical protein [Pedobacter boryungensis]NQX32466.1 hypothetical protein [Pedobacter boryungensis]
MLKYIILLLFTLSLSNNVKAATGCILNSNLTKIYTSVQNGTNYKSNSSSTALTGCTYKQTTSPCTVSGAGPAFLGDTTILNCPLDYYTWLILLVFSGFGFFYIRNKALI